MKDLENHIRFLVNPLVAEAYESADAFKIYNAEQMRALWSIAQGLYIGNLQSREQIDLLREIYGFPARRGASVLNPSATAQMVTLDNQGILKLLRNGRLSAGNPNSVVTIVLNEGAQIAAEHFRRSINTGNRAGQQQSTWEPVAEAA